jgi:hypothetical protein
MDSSSRLPHGLNYPHRLSNVKHFFVGVKSAGMGKGEKGCVPSLTLKAAAVFIEDFAKEISCETFQRI